MRFFYVFVILLTFTIFAWSKDFPKNDITLIVPAASGGSTDIISRTLAKEAASIFGVNFIIKNITGAGNADGLTLATRSDANGYTLVMAPADIVTLQLMGRVSWNATRDFLPIVGVIRMPAALVTMDTSKWNSAKDFVDRAQEVPYPQNVASSSISGIWFMSAMKFAEVSKIKINIKQYTDSFKIFKSLSEGDAEVAVIGYEKALPDNIKVLCVMTDVKDPEIHRCKDEGYDVNIGTWWVLMAPRGVKSKELQTLREGFEKAWNSEGFQHFMSKQGLVADYWWSENIKNFMNEQADLFIPLLKKNYLLAR